MIVITLQLNTSGKRTVSLAVLFLGCLLLVWLTVSQFVTNTLADDGFVVLRSTLISAAAYFPSSARLQARLAKVELAEATEETDLRRAEAAARRAVSLSPWSSNNHLLLASVRSLQGDVGGTEAATRRAIQLAPSSAQARWQLANLLVRQEKLDEALQEFQLAIASDMGLSFLPGAVDLVWRVSEGNVEKVSRIVGSEPQRRLRLAQYLLKQSHLTEAIVIYKSIERPSLLDSAEATEFLNALIAAKELELARDLWLHLIGAEKSGDEQLIYNGGFEKELVPALSQFDWKIAHSAYAVLSLDTIVAHTGKRSLRLSLTGRDTTVLGKELSQTVVVKPGRRYRLECYIRTDKLITTEAPYLSVVDSSTLAPLAISKPIPEGSGDWQLYALDFTAPTQSNAVLVTLKRTPRFSYDAPSKGTLWLDDFILREARPNK